MVKKTFGVWPAIFIFCLSVGLANHVMIVPFLLSAAKRDAWMCVLLGLIVSMPWVLVPLWGILKKMNKEERFDEWLRRRIPPGISKLIVGFFLLLLLLTGFEALVITTNWTATTYLPKTPPFVVCIVFLGLCLYAASAGLRSIAFASCVLLPAVVVLGDFVMSANLPHKDYRYLLPMLENGFSPILKGSFYSLTAACELYALLFIRHHIHSSPKRWHLAVLTLFLAMLTIGPLTGALSEFGPVEAAKMRFPAFSQWRLVSIGRYFEHVDFFAIFQWLSGAMIRLSLSLYILMEFGPFHKLKRKWIMQSVYCGLFLAAAYYMLNHMLTYFKIVEQYFLYAGAFIFVLIMLIWAISLLDKHRKHKSKPALEERVG